MTPEEKQKRIDYLHRRIGEIMAAGWDRMKNATTLQMATDINVDQLTRIYKEVAELQKPEEPDYALGNGILVKRAGTGVEMWIDPRGSTGAPHPKWFLSERACQELVRFLIDREIYRP